MSTYRATRPGRRGLTLAAYLSMLFLGVANTIVGAAARNIGLTPFQIGLFLAMQNAGFMAGVLVSGALADVTAKPRVLLVGSVVLSLAFFSFYATDLIWLNLIIMAAIGAGTGTYEGVTDALLLALHRRRQNLHININHFFVTFGSILVTVYLISLQMRWRQALLQSGAVVLLLGVLYALARHERPSRRAEPLRHTVRALTREPLVGALFAATALVVGVELGTTGLLTTYLMESQAFTQTTSKLGLLAFLGGIAGGRLLVGFFGGQNRLGATLLALFGAATLIYAVVVLAPLGPWAYAGFFAAGLSISALMPMMITLAGLAYPATAGTVIGAIKVAIPIGGIVVPFLLSLAARQTSLATALLLLPLALLLAFVWLALAMRAAPGATGWREPAGS